jgi:AAA domain
MLNRDRSEKKPEHRVRLTRAFDLEPREVEWLWAGRVPLGMITMFAGDPKLAKSLVTLDMAAAVSRGLPLPMSDVPNQPGSTIERIGAKSCRQGFGPGSRLFWELKRACTPTSAGTIGGT